MSPRARACTAWMRAAWRRAPRAGAFRRFSDDAAFKAPGAPIAAASGENVELMVRNLPAATTRDELRAAFIGVCNVLRVRVSKDTLSGKPRHAFVTVSAAAADEARLAMDGAEVGGQQIAVQLSIPNVKPNWTAPAPHVQQSKPGTLDAAAALPQQSLPRSDSAAAEINKQLVDCSTAEDILRIFESRVGEFNYVNFATSLHRIGVLRRTFDPASEPRVKKLAERAASNIVNYRHKWESRHLANACWGVAKFGQVEAPKLFEAVASEAPMKMATYQAQELSNTAWAFATAGIEAPALFGALAAESRKRILRFDPQNLSNIVWAYATARVEGPELFAAVAKESVKKMSGFTPQALANTSWAFAMAGVAAPALFEAIGAQSIEQMATFDSQAMANMIWAFSKAGVSAPALFQAIAAEASKKMATFNSQDLANTAWAFAKAGVEAPLLFEAVAAESSNKIASFNPQELANIKWAFSTTGVAAPALFEAVAARQAANDAAT